ncbi:MAG: sulfite exporter TauE/SafE family protein [Candidatus Dormibacterales bacterium]
MGASREALSARKGAGRRIDLTIGGVAGLAGGLLGVGGGFVMVPLQTMLAGRSQHRASGTSLAAIIPIALVGAATYYFGSNTPQTDVTVAVVLGAGAAAGALIGALAACRVSDAGLRVLVAVLLVGVGLKEVYDAAGGTAPQLVGTAVPDLPPSDLAFIAVGGLGIGVLSGLTGVGGGILVVPLLTLGFGIGQRVAQGTSLLAILPAVAIGAVTRSRSGDVDVRAASWMAAAGVPAALAGSAVALWLPQRALGGLFGVFLLFAATRTWPRAQPADKIR